MRNANQQELDHFATLANHWWDPNGPLRTLHDINPARLQFIEQHTSLTNQRVIDVGCGGGILAESMARRGAQVTGIDLADSLIEQATLHALSEGIDIAYHCVSVETFAQEHAGTADIVTCMEMLEHVPDPQAIMTACSQLLKPGGWLLVSTLNKTTKATLLAVYVAEYVLRLLPQGTHDANKFIAPHQLAQWARQNGLTAQTLTGLHYHPLTRQTHLAMPADINYLMAFQKPS